MQRFRNKFGMTDLFYFDDKPCHAELVSGPNIKPCKTFQKLAAFTLAEVLITLAIVGIVAAMTIPTLINNIQERQFHAMWKESFSLVNAAVKMVVVNDPKLVASIGYTPTKEFVDALKSNLKIVDTCGVNTDYDKNRCDNYSSWSPDDVHYKWSGLTNGDRRYKTLSEGALGGYDWGLYAILLNNGVAIYVGGSHSGPSILVDVNNYLGGPNILGKDVYAINLYSSNSWRFPDRIYVEDLSVVPYGAPGSRCTTDKAPCSLGKPAEGFGVSDCSQNVGKSDANYIVEASGAGCSYKYLHEK